MGYLMLPGANTARGLFECCLVWFDCSRDQIIIIASNQCSPVPYVWLFCSDSKSSWSGLKIHTWHCKAARIICIPSPHPVLNHFVINTIVAVGARPSRHESRATLVPLHKLSHEEGDIVLVWGATFPNMMKSKFQIPDRYMPQVRSRTTKAGMWNGWQSHKSWTTKAGGRPQHFGLLSCGGNSA